MMFKDRREAGQMLGKELKRHGFEDPYVFGLPRGGLITAREVAKVLSAPFDGLICRKLGVPGNPEFAFGAIAPNGVEYIDWEIAERIGLSPFEITKVVAEEKEELQRREALYRHERKYPDLAGKTAIICDDGIATGATIKAATQFIRLLNPKKIIVASPVAARDSAASIRSLADQVISLIETDEFYAVGQFYLRFPQITDKRAIAVLKKHSK